MFVCIATKKSIEESWDYGANKKDKKDLSRNTGKKNICKYLKGIFYERGKIRKLYLLQNEIK